VAAFPVVDHLTTFLRSGSALGSDPASVGGSPSHWAPIRLMTEFTETCHQVQGLHAAQQSTRRRRREESVEGRPLAFTSDEIDRFNLSPQAFRSPGADTST
jgi:hypothetical protein